MLHFILVDNRFFVWFYYNLAKVLPYALVMILTRFCHDFNKILPWIHDSARCCQDLAMISTRSCHDFRKILPWFQKDLAMIATRCCYDFNKILPWFQQYILPWFRQDLAMISRRSCHISRKSILLNEHATSQNPV